MKDFEKMSLRDRCMINRFDSAVIGYLSDDTYVSGISYGIMDTVRAYFWLGYDDEIEEVINDVIEAAGDIKYEKYR